MKYTPLILLLSLLQSFLVNVYVTHTYMDEIFHVPQAQSICGTFRNREATQWDEKITTPPGLYYVTLFMRPSLAFARHPNNNNNEVGVYPIHSSSAQKEAVRRECRDALTTASLRWVSFVFNAATLVLLRWFTKNDAAAALVTSFPPLFFFGQLYYTDAGGLFFALASYAFCIREEKEGDETPSTITEEEQQEEEDGGDDSSTSSVTRRRIRPRRGRSTAAEWSEIGTVMSWVCAFAAISFRQTNVVWILMIVCLSVSDLAIGSLPDRPREAGAWFTATLIPAFSRLFLRWDARLWIAIVKKHIGHGLVFGERWLCFDPCCASTDDGEAYFIHHYLVKSESIVQGDQQNHQITLHLAQICYLSAVLAIFSGVLPSHLVHFLRESIRMRKPAWGGLSRGGVGIAALALAFVVAAVDRFSVIHPFTLADNRHFTFYLNSRVFSRFNGKGKFVLVPLYFISLGSLASHFKTWIDGGGGGGGADARAKRAMRVLTRRAKLGFVLASVLSVSPLPLIEPRYFFVPLGFHLAMFGQSAGIGSRSVVAAIVAANLTTCFIVDYVFWMKPFVWGDGSLARFMW